MFEDMFRDLFANKKSDRADLAAFFLNVAREIREMRMRHTTWDKNVRSR